MDIRNAYFNSKVQPEVKQLYSFIQADIHPLMKHEQSYQLQLFYVQYFHIGFHISFLNYTRHVYHLILK